jgi:hypothetical protein
MDAAAKRTLALLIEGGAPPNHDRGRQGARHHASFNMRTADGPMAGCAGAAGLWRRQRGMLMTI